MNLNKLFSIQKVLDNRIVKEHNLQGVDLLDKKILSLQVELGELANELPEVFKFWSSKKNNYEKALKEYVDGLHFILSVGLEIDCTPVAVDLISKETERNVTKQFIGLFDIVSAVRHNANYFKKGKTDKNGLYRSYHNMVSVFLGLGEMLGFTWEQIETAYLEKNKINHERQENGY